MTASTVAVPAPPVPATPATAEDDLAITAPHCWDEIPGRLVAIHGTDKAIDLHEQACPTCLRELTLLERA